MQQEELDTLYYKQHVQDLIRATNADDADDEGPVTHERVEQLHTNWKRKRWSIVLANGKKFVGTFDRMDNNPYTWYYETLKHHEALAPFIIEVDIKQAEELFEYPVDKAEMITFDCYGFCVEIDMQKSDFCPRFYITGHIASFTEESAMHRIP